jgi:superfamily II DNA or RNA helicase
MKVIVSNIYSVLKTDNVELKKALGKKYQCKVPGYQYTPQYRRRSWDGTKKFFSSASGKFRTGLLPLVCKDLDFLEMEYEVEDTRTEVPTRDHDIPTITLRDYQEQLVTDVLDKKRCVLKSPTGSGKTVILAALLKALEGETGLVLFNKKQLLYQTYKFLTEHGIDVGVAFGDGVEIKPITLCTIQSIDKVIDSHVKTSKFIIFDEIHEFAKGKLSEKVLKSFPEAFFRIGMTATPPSERYAFLNLISSLGPVVEEVTAEDLIDEGYLTKPLIQITTLPTLSQPLEGVPYPDVYDQYIINNNSRNEGIVKLTESITEDTSNPSKILILTKNLEHASILHKMLPGSYKLEGKDSLLERESVLKEFRTSTEPQVIIGTIIFQTGVDIPELTHLINARGLKSEIATLQALGRTLRKHSKKTKVFIYDFIDKAPYLEQHSAARITSYKSLNFDIEIDGTPITKRS